MALPLNVLASQVCLESNVNYKNGFSPPKRAAFKKCERKNISRAACARHEFRNRRSVYRNKLKKTADPGLAAVSAFAAVISNEKLTELCYPRHDPHLCPRFGWSNKQCTVVNCLVECLIRSFLFYGIFFRFVRKFIKKSLIQRVYYFLLFLL